MSVWLDWNTCLVFIRRVLYYILFSTFTIMKRSLKIRSHTVNTNIQSIFLIVCYYHLVVYGSLIGSSHP